MYFRFRFVALFAGSVLAPIAVALELEFGHVLAFDDDLDSAGETNHLQLIQVRATPDAAKKKVHVKEVPYANLAYDGSSASSAKQKNVVSASQGLGLGSHESWPKWPQKSQFPKDIPFNFDVDTNVKMLLWTDWGFITDESAADLPNCKLDGVGKVKYDTGVIPDPNYNISDYDVVIFHMSNLAYHFPEYYTLPAHKPKGQIWVAACGEPFDRPQTGIDCHLINDEATMKRFDAVSSFSLESDFPAIQDPLTENLMRMDIPEFEGPELAYMVFSDCNSETRNAWTQEVINAFKARDRESDLLSFGKCFKNAQEPLCNNPDPTHHMWVNRCAARPFKFVAENIQEPWYVTEKIWDAFAEGAIPVYWGPPEVKLWVPEGSIIFADDFNSTDALVDRILSFTTEDFAAYRAWKKLPQREWKGWNKAWRLSHYTLVPRLCEAASRHKLYGGRLFTPDKEHHHGSHRKRFGGGISR